MFIIIKRHASSINRGISYFSQIIQRVKLLLEGKLCLTSAFNSLVGGIRQNDQGTADLSRRS
jgi:hypothetical protein